MSPPRTGQEVLEGTRALERADWASARVAFEAALTQEESAEADEGLGLALWFEGDTERAIELRERAFTAYARSNRCDDAARVAVWVSHQHMLGGRPSAARGWLARAERALEGVSPGVGHGWVAVERARHAATPDEKVAHATGAIAIAQKYGADDLEVFALSLLGRAEVSAGRRESGLLLLEEAMASATAGRVRNVHTLAEAYCNLVMACSEAGDWERAAEWCEHVEQFATSHDTEPLLGACRTVHADVLLATGRWPEAEHALEAALNPHERSIPELSAPRIATLSELRVYQGRLRDAEQLLAGREEHPASLRALALLRIAEGRPAEAVVLLERGLACVDGDAVRGVQLLAALVDARLACDDHAAAATAAEELDSLAETTGMRIGRARAALASARVLLASGQPAEAAEPARRALREFGELAMPLGSGESRLALARAVAEDRPDVAADEARTALDAFRGLGASRAVDAATDFLRSLGGGTAGRPRVAGELTAREQQVLGLVAMGMSNARIARTLTISERTAGHHVSRILTKLGVHNRTEAAAHARRE